MIPSSNLVKKEEDAGIAAEEGVAFVDVEEVGVVVIEEGTAVVVAAAVVEEVAIIRITNM